jgi:hypothetical protein
MKNIIINNYNYNYKYNIFKKDIIYIKICLSKRKSKENFKYAYILF